MPPSPYFASKSYQSAWATISPGTDAIGSSLPSSEHSTSAPSAWASMITRGSWRRAASTAASSSAASVTLLMPTLEPRRDGLTQSGSPSSSAASRHPSPEASTKSTCGIAASESRRLKVSLSRQVAEAGTSEPDVRDVEDLERALNRAVLAAGAMEDREGDVGAEQAAPGAQLNRPRHRAASARRARSAPRAPRARHRAAPGRPTRPSAARRRARSRCRR